MRAFLKKLLIILFWLAVWQLLSLAVHNVILLSGPLETLKALWALIPTKDFWISVATSLARILAGFLAGSAAGILLASLSASSRLAEEVLNVPVTVVKDLRFPVNHWLMPRIRQPSRIETKAMIYPCP